MHRGLAKQNEFSTILVWWSGVVVSTLASINEVNLRRTRLVLRWVIVSGSIPGAGHLFQYVTNHVNAILSETIFHCAKSRI